MSIYRPPLFPGMPYTGASQSTVQWRHIQIVQRSVGNAAVPPRGQPRSQAPQQPRFYFNMNPAAAIPVDRSSIVRLEHFAESYRLRRPDQHGLLVPNSKYVFVRMTSGEIRMHPQFRHPVLAEGKPVLYAGEAYFANGNLSWWSNGSGNYRPDPDHALQANLPMERFFTHEDILRGKQKNQS
jgi:hypothetical protein